METGKKWYVRFTSIYMGPGKWSESVVYASDEKYAEAKFYARIAHDWGNGMLRNVKVISITHYQED